MPGHPLGAILDQRAQPGHIADAGGRGEGAALAVGECGVVEPGADGEAERAEPAMRWRMSRASVPSPAGSREK